MQKSFFEQQNFHGSKKRKPANLLYILLFSKKREMSLTEDRSPQILKDNSSAEIKSTVKINDGKKLEIVSVVENVEEDDTFVSINFTNCSINFEDLPQFLKQKEAIVNHTEAKFYFSATMAWHAVPIAHSLQAKFTEWHFCGVHQNEFLP